MKIGIDLRALAAGKHTGVEEYVVGLLQTLFLIDTENEYVLFFNAWGNIEPDFSWVPKSPRITWKRFRVPNKLLNLSLWYFHYPKLDHLLGGVDIFFMPNLNFAAFSKNVRVFVTAHDLSFELFPEAFSWKQRVWHYLVNFRGLLGRADAVIAVSHSTALDLRDRYHVPPEKIHTILSGISKRFVPLSRNDPKLLDVQKRYHLPYRFILSLGTFEPRKNLGALISAFEVLQATAVGELLKYELVLAGAPGWKCEDLLERIARSPAREKIHLVGFVKEEDKPALYALATVFVYPSLYEGFGFPPLEALATGVPVIASHSASLPEIIGEAGVLIDPYRPDELLIALREVLGNRELQDTLKQAALVQCQKFSWSHSAEELRQQFSRNEKGFHELHEVFL